MKHEEHHDDSFCDDSECMRACIRESKLQRVAEQLAGSNYYCDLSRSSQETIGNEVKVIVAGLDPVETFRAIRNAADICRERYHYLQMATVAAMNELPEQELSEAARDHLARYRREYPAFAALARDA
jgi:hypothetical protein